jgi:hypothetical protein
MRTTFCAALLLVSLAACGGGDGDEGGSADEKADVAPSETLTTPEPSPTVTESAAPPINIQGNAETNPACQLLTVEQVAAAAGLDVIGMLGLVADKTNPDKLSESCTWFLDPKVVQSSLVVQYTVFGSPPADLKAYYPQVIEQGFAKRVPRLGAISKINGHVLDTIFKRSEIHVTLLTHAEATAEDQAAMIGLMRLVIAGIKQ